MKICPVGAELSRFDRQIDRVKLIVAFRNFAKASEHLSVIFDLSKILLFPG
jgi:hypothetical protein